MQKKIKIKSFAPLQLGKMCAVIYGLLALLFVPVFIGMAAFGALANQESGAAQAFGLGFGIFMAVFTPVIYAFFGFLTGVIGGFFYNVVAKWIGGIELEVATEEEAAKTVS